MKHRHLPRYMDDADFTTNAPSYYEDLARKEKLIRLLAERIWGYEEILDETLEQIQERFRTWDKNLEDFPEDVKDLLQQWLDDGTLDHIINDTIFNWKLDTSIFEQFRDTITAQLQQTEEFDKYNRNADYPLFIPTSDGMNQTVHPSVKYFPNGWNGWKYWMAHTPYPASNDDYENPCISVSNDGINWQDPVGITNPIDQPTTQQLADGYHMSDTHLVVVGGGLECWYRYNKNNVIDQIMRKTSTDGVNWSTREVVLETTGTTMNLSPSVLYEDGVYKLWYVNESLKLMYTQSPTGKIHTWTNWRTVPLSFTNNPASLWHIDVFRDTDNTLYLIANCSVGASRWLYLGTSPNNDGFSFTGLTEILRPSLDDPANWDSKEIYRSSLVKVEDMYRLYYSARSRVTSDRWQIGVVEGYTPYTMQKFDLEKSGTSSRNIQGSMTLKKGNKIYTNPSFNAYIDEKEVRLLSPNGNLAAIIRMSNGGLEIVDKDGTKLYQLSVEKIKTDRHPTGAGLKPTELKLFEAGVAGVRLALTPEGDFRVLHDTQDIRKNMRIGGLVFESPSSIQGERGAVRYNLETNKHQGFNGTTWNDFY